MTDRTIDGPQGIVDNYDGQYLECRDEGHIWGRRGYFHGAGGIVLRASWCPRCGTQKVGGRTSTGALVPARYRYPEGYLLKEAHLARGDWWAESVRRSVVYASEDEMMATLTAPRRKAARR